MNIHTVGSALAVIGLLAVVAPSDRSLAQANDANVAAPKAVHPNTNTNPHKHRYWRFRGGKHPHYGSRRVHS